MGISILGRTGVAAALGADVSTGSALSFLARLRRRPPDAPVTNNVAPTETRKTRVYFFEGSRVERRMSGFEDVVGASLGSNLSLLLDIGFDMGRAGNEGISHERASFELEDTRDVLRYLPDQSRSDCCDK